MKLKSFFTTKEMVSTLKGLPPEWEKNFARHTYGKGLITRIYRELKNLNSKKINDPLKKWANDPNRAFPKEEIQMTKAYMKKFSASLAIKEMKIRITITLRFHLIRVRMVTIKNTNNKCW
jgi:hypothetical protein